MVHIFVPLLVKLMYLCVSVYARTCIGWHSFLRVCVVLQLFKERNDVMP